MSVGASVSRASDDGATATRGRAGRAVPRLHGLAWVVWRRHRVAFAACAVVLLVAAVWLPWQRAELVSLLERPETWRCSAPYCPELDTAADDDLLAAGRLLSWLPVLIGVFVGGPLFARELESGTATLIWSQSVSRCRWLLTTLTVPLVVTGTLLAALAALFTWAWRPAEVVNEAALHGASGWAPFAQWYDNDVFLATGPMPVASLVLALVLGATTGLVLRRTVPATAVTLLAAVYTQRTLLAQELRPRLLPREFRAVTRADDPEVLDRGMQPSEAFWRLDDGFVTAAGEKVPRARVDAVLRDCGGVFEGDCLASHGVAGRYVEGHPASHFLPLQWLEAGVCVAVAVALLGFCLYWVRR